MSALLQIAQAEIGVAEIPGAQHNPRIMEYAREVGFDSWYNSDETPWCSMFLNWAANRAGLQRSGAGLAESWRNIGTPVIEPQPGDVVLLTSAPGNTRITHVGIFQEYNADKTRIMVLGGNQSNKVTVTPYRSNVLIGYRRLSASGTPSQPAPAPARPVIHDTTQPATPQLLRKGDRGPAVAELQNALKKAGFDPGSADGDFGDRTEQALKAFQAFQLGLTTTGEYDSATREMLATAVEENEGSATA
jgi:uncharacterized protein (TIGR02594 family)